MYRNKQTGKTISDSEFDDLPKAEQSNYEEQVFDDMDEDDDDEDELEDMMGSGINGGDQSAFDVDDSQTDFGGGSGGGSGASGDF